MDGPDEPALPRSFVRTEAFSRRGASRCVGRLARKVSQAERYAPEKYANVVPYRKQPVFERGMKKARHANHGQGYRWMRPIQGAAHILPYFMNLQEHPS